MGTISINKQYISTKNTYTGQNKPKYIVIHETDNFSEGAGARRHAQAQAAGHLDISVHYYAGSDGIYQAAAHTDGTYSVGREYGRNHAIHDATNRNTINIEICVNVDGDYTKARQNAIELVMYLLGETGIPAERVIRHFDAKGKYCPRKMLDNPALWEDFKAQIGQSGTSQPENKKPASEENEGEEVWYRVGSSLNYTQKQFILDVQAATGSKQDGIAGDETIGNTITVSRAKNKHHAVVTPLEQRMKALGYYAGEIEADKGDTPCFGKGMEAAVNSYQRNVLGYKNLDGEITAGKKMWKSLLGMV